MARLSWKLAWAATWLALVAYAMFAAPPHDVALESALWGGILSGNFGHADPSVIAVFLLLGVNVDLFIVFLLRDGRLQRVPGWPFALASFALGSFVLIPYLLLRSKNPRRPLDAPAGRITRVISGRAIGFVLVAAVLALLVYAFAFGHADRFIATFHSSWLVNVMTLDFLLEVALLSLLVQEARALDPPVEESSFARTIRWVPLLGPTLWNALVRHDR